MELLRFAKPTAPSGVRFESSALLKWFRGREARCSSAKRETQVQIPSEPQHAEMAELAMHHLAKVDHAGSTPVLRSISLAPLA